MPDETKEAIDLDALVEDAAEGLWTRLRDVIRLTRKLEGFVF